MNWITNFASWYHQSFWILNTTAIWIVYLLTLVRKSFNFEKQRLQNFIAGSARQEDIMDNGPLALLLFIQQFNLGISVMFQILS